MDPVPIISNNSTHTDNWNKFFQVEPSTLTWNNIKVGSTPRNIWGQESGPEVKIIKNVSGTVKPGTTMAIMGASGAGKTTLLNVLTGRNLSRFNVDGVVKINGKLADITLMKEFTAYVQQEDLFLPSLTVREHLIFQSLVRMDSSLPLDLKVKRINFVMGELSLFKCADTMIGGVSVGFKGISGGESKRLAFATEILTNPSIMFCDEPTSGLDAFMAHQLISIVKKLAKRGRTVVCTIHQPSTDTFELFDQLLLMADGRVAYLGPLKSAIAYFNNLGFKCPMNYNPADYFVKELAVIPGKEYECRNKVAVICDYYMSKNPAENMHHLSSFMDRGKGSKDYKVTTFAQYQALIWRSWVVTLRQPMLTYIRLAQSVTISTVLGLNFLNQKYDSMGVFNMNAAMFLIVTNMSYQNVLAVVDTFCKEMPIFIREHHNGMYTVLCYFIGKNLAEFPIFVAIPMIFMTIFYNLVGFAPHFSSFLFSMLVAILISCCSVSFGYFMSCLCAKTDIALAFTAPVMSPLQLWAGFLLNSESVPSYFKTLRNISWFYYGFKLLAFNQWERIDTVDNCTAINLAASALNQTKSDPCFEDGMQVIDFLKFSEDSYFIDLFCLAFIGFVFRSLAYWLLMFRIKFTNG